MKLRKLALVPIAAAVMAIGTPAQAVTSVGGTVDGVVYTLTNLTNDFASQSQSFQLTANTSGYIYSAFLDNVNIKVSDKVDLASSALTSVPTGWGSNLTSNSLNNSGCTGSGGGFLCSTAANPVAAPGGTYTFQFSVNKDSGNWLVPGATLSDGTLASWHIGARYINSDGNKVGSLVSISAVPEPEIYAMLLAGLGLMGFVARRRRESLESGAA